MRTNAQLWNDLLWTSGCDLEKPKCLHHITNYQFTPCGEPVLQAGTFGPKVWIQLANRKSATQMTNLIKMASAHTAHKTLGHWLEPTQHNHKQHSVLKQQRDDIASW